MVVPPPTSLPPPRTTCITHPSPLKRTQAPLLACCHVPEMDPPTWSSVDNSMREARWCCGAVAVMAIPFWKIFVFGGKTGQISEDEKQVRERSCLASSPDWACRDSKLQLGGQMPGSPVPCLPSCLQLTHPTCVVVDLFLPPCLPACLPARATTRTTWRSWTPATSAGRTPRSRARCPRREPTARWSSTPRSAACASKWLAWNRYRPQRPANGREQQ